MKFAALFLLAAATLLSQEIAHSTPPRVVNKVEPEYTKEARAAHIEGTVALKTVIDVDGTPTGINVLHRLDPGLDQKAVECLRKWRFSPRLVDGKPVSTPVTVEINFRLR